MRWGAAAAADAEDATDAAGSAAAASEAETSSSVLQPGMQCPLKKILGEI